MADDNTQSDIQITPTSGSGNAPASEQGGGAAAQQDDTQGQQQTQQTTPQTIQLPGDAAPEPTTPASNAFSLEEDALAADQAPAPPSKYSVPQLVQEKFPDLIELVKNTESMDDDERDYWMQILPIMTEEQIAKFRDILVTEKQQLEKLDKEYEDELSRLNEKHMIEWKEFESKEKREEREVKEKAAEQQEKESEEELLKRLQEI
ncbi:MAG TPA: hypothetical protein PKA32_00935 [Candidatus Gracilibacteria bacterium]|nr:hypothetical protein [Candidatus Gracilibacteria bacterium]